MNTRTESKNNILSTTIVEVLGDKKSFARIRFFSLYIRSLCEVQTIYFEKLPVNLDKD
jgi:hypothetical protein